MPLTLLYVAAVAAAVSALVSFVVSYATRRLSAEGAVAPEEALLSSRRKGGRERKRYVVFEVSTSASLSEGDVWGSIVASYKRLFGEVGFSKSGAKLVLYDDKAKRGIARVRSESLDQLLVAMRAVSEINGNKVLIVPLWVAGTIRSAKRRLT